MRRYTIRYRPDGDGFWYEIRDRDHRRVVKTAWLAGKKPAAQVEAKRVRAELVRQTSEAR